MDNCRLLAVLFLFGRILSPLYALAMRVRARLYARGVLASTKLCVPVISVGNLTMGGTGKTPMVIYLCRLLSGAFRPGIVSRGYGGNSRQPLNLVSDGANILRTAPEVGDEPMLLAQSLPGVSVVTSRSRSGGGAYLIGQGLADLLILDDGFQHLAVQRDLNLVLFSAQAAVQSMWVFPGGMLREPHLALARADCFVVTGREDGEGHALRTWLQEGYPQIPVYEGRYEPVGLYDQEQGRVGLDALQGASLFAFCGIANPQSFRQTLEQNFLVKGWRSFRDHHPFSREDMAEVVGQAVALGCSALITTEKDFVKVKTMAIGLPLWVLAVELRLEQGFDQFVLEWLAAPELKGKDSRYHIIKQRRSPVEAFE